MGKGKERSLDLAGLDHLDTPGALLLCALRDKGVELTGVGPEHQSLLDLICGLDLKPLPKPPTVSRAREFVTQLGKAADEAWRDTLDVIAFVGRAASAVGYALAHPSAWRRPSISRQVTETGVDALPIVGLLAVMIASSSPTRASPSCGRTAARTSPSTSSRCRCCARWAC